MIPRERAMEPRTDRASSGVFVHIAELAHYDISKDRTKAVLECEYSIHAELTENDKNNPFPWLLRKYAGTPRFWLLKEKSQIKDIKTYTYDDEAMHSKHTVFEIEYDHNI